MPTIKRVGNTIFGFAPIQLLSRPERWRKQAKLLKLSKEACQRLEWIIYYETKANKNVPPAGGTFFYCSKGLLYLEKQV